MHSITEDLKAFQQQLEKGSIQRAYGAIIAYMLGLRSYFKNSAAAFPVSGLYRGTMDMTYFALFPPALKDRNLKIAIVFNYAAFRFEAWLSGGNREVQRQYWELFENGQWPRYRLVTPAKGVDSILECDLAAGFDLDDPDALNAAIEKTTLAFINDIERFLAEHDALPFLSDG